MEDELKDKEDVIEDQNDDIEGNDDIVEHKEDVIEDQNDYDKGMDDAILKKVDSMFEMFSRVEAKLDKISDSLTLFAESGGVIRETEAYNPTPPEPDNVFEELEDLDFSL